MISRLVKFGGASALALSLLAAPAAAAESWDDWDANDSGLIEMNEFNERFAERDVYGEWDADGDGALTEDEFNAGVYASYDDDDTGVIEDPEWGDVGDDLDEDGIFDF